MHVCQGDRLLKDIFSHRVSKNIVAMAFLQLITYAVPLLVLLHLTSILSVRNYGVLAFAFGCTQFAILAMDFGYTLSATERISRWREKRRAVSKLLGAITLVRLLIFCVVALLTIVFLSNTTLYSEHGDLFYFSLLVLLGHCFQYVFFFTGIERMGFITSISIVSKLLYLVLVITFVKDDHDYILVPIFDGAAQIIAAGISLMLIKRLGYGLLKPSVEQFKYSIRMTVGFFFSRLSSSTYLLGGVLFLGLLSNPAMVAAYSIAEKIYQAMQQLFYPFVQALYPFMARERRPRLMMKLLSFIFILVLCVAVFSWFITHNFFEIFFEKQWLSAVDVLDVLLVALVVHVLAVMSGYPLAASMGKTVTANRTVFLGALAYIVCLLYAFSQSTITAIFMAWALVISESVVFLSRALLLWPLALKSER